MNDAAAAFAEAQAKIHAAQEAQAKAIASDLFAKATAPSDTTRQAEFRLTEPVDIELRGEAFRVSHVRVELTVFADETEYVKVEGHAHKLTQDGRPDGRESARWRSLPEQVGAPFFVLLGWKVA